MSGGGVKGFFSRIFNKGGASAPPKPRGNHVYFDIYKNESDLGRMEFELYDDKWPKTSENFRRLCTGENQAGYTYKGSFFHRIINGFMAQGGDFTHHNGMGGASIYGSKFPDENLNLHHSKRGLLSMANSGPDTNGSQFFITFAPTPWLDGKHVVFGEMVKGEEVLKEMEKIWIIKWKTNA